jgi:hypothetical protein
MCGKEIGEIRLFLAFSFSCFLALECIVFAGRLEGSIRFSRVTRGSNLTQRSSDAWFGTLTLGRVYTRAKGMFLVNLQNSVKQSSSRLDRKSVKMGDL